MKAVILIIISLRIANAGCMDTSLHDASFMKPISAAYRIADGVLSSNVSTMNKIVDLIKESSDKKLNNIQIKSKLISIKEVAVSAEISDLLMKIAKVSK